MYKIVCRICLRSDFTRTKDVDKTLADFHDELCDFDVSPSSLLQICPICEYLLKKFYNFKLKCQQSQKLLKKCKQRKKDLENLHEHIPPPSLGLCPEKTIYEYLSSDFRPVLQSSIQNLSGHGHSDLITDDVAIKEEISAIGSKIEEDPILLCQEVKLNNDISTYNQENGNDNDLEVKKESDFSELDSHSDDDEITLQQNEKDNSSDSDDYLIKTKMKKIPIKKEISESSKKVYVKRSKMICKNPEKLKNRILELIEQGEFKDLGPNVNIDKEIFVNMFDKCNLNGLRGMLPNQQRASEMPKIKKLLLYLHKRYHPKYETVFNIEYLDTMAKKMEEFNGRQHSRKYLEAEFKCPICFKVFDAENKLNYHNKWHESSQPHVCDICRMRFISRTTLTVHCKNNHCTVYRCKQCPVVTYNYGAMVNHYDHHKGVEYSCPICLSCFRNKSSMNTHRLLAHQTSHICPLCARSFVSEKGLYLHTKLKHREEASTIASVSCEQCSAKFATPEVLQKHVKEAHKKVKRNFNRCGECKQLFKSLEELKQHKITMKHTAPGRGGVSWRGRSTPAPPPRVNVFGPDKPYRTCPICLVEVANTHHTALYKHFTAQHPDEPYSAHADKMEFLCEHCGKGFRVRSLYRDHLNAHSGLRPYECVECSARFPALHKLRAHQIRHRPPRYQCKDCGKLFLTAANLSCHRRTHIGDRRYKCEICFKGFLHASSLTEHVKGVHHQIRRIKKAPTREKLNN